jgi:pyruvate dehydrogenase E2 component (dihydrolipoamide acetyltransferase)
MSDLLANLAPWPTGDFSVFGEVEIVPVGKIQRFVAANLGRNWVAIPHVTHNDDADVTEMETRRKAHNATASVKLTPVPLLVKALADALKAFPQFNASLDPAKGELILKKYVHIGVAVETPSGLLVAVIRDCDAKPVTVIAEEVLALSEKARTKGLSLAEMSGGSMTLTSLGHIGGTSFTPIVNAPEVAILGVTRARPVPQPAEDGGIAWRQMLPLSLSYDHRVINGADAARFCRFVGERLAAPDLFG